MTAMTNAPVFVGLPHEANTAVGEVIAWLAPIILATVMALWRRTAVKSKLQMTIIKAIIKGIETGSQELGEDDTQIVKRAVKDEAVAAGVQQHVAKIVETVKRENGDHPQI